MKFFKEKEFVIVVFATGAAILVVEILGSRILSPFFGNTIYTYSSIITVVLAALSFGYYTGGILADKKPKREIFYQIILIASFFTLLIDILTTFFLGKISRSFSTISGPLVASLILFFMPSFLLGTLSPFSIKLQSLKSKAGVGRISGEVFFWSTLGSILGSLLSGFYLVPTFGIKKIILGVSGFLFVIGFWGTITSKAKKRVLMIISLLFSLFFILSSQITLTRTGSVFQTEGLYERLEVIDFTHEGKPARLLRSETNNSSAIYHDSDELVWEYSDYFRLFKLVKPEIDRVLVMGAGAYSLPRAFLSETPMATVEVVDIEPKLLEIAKTYFRFEDNPRLINFVGDARIFLINRDQTYDVIFSDLYLSMNTIPTHVVTQEFFSLYKSHLSENGVLIANLIGSLSPVKKSLLLSSMATFSSVFPNAYFFAVLNPQSPQIQNVIALGINGQKKLSFPEKIEDPFSKKAFSHLIDIQSLGLGKQLIFTDDYAPVEFYSALAIKRSKEAALTE